MAGRLVDDLKRRIELAKQAEVGRTLDSERTMVESQEQRLREIMQWLPRSLLEAADNGERFVKVMRLKQRDGDYESSSLPRSIFSEHVVISVDDLRGVARHIHDYLVSEGLTVEIQRRREKDEGQGRAWTNYILVAKF